MAKRLEKKHLLAIRWFHWINFPILFLMIWSGILIYWANDVYSVKILGYELFHFFPQWFYDYLNIPFRLADGISMHFLFMWFFTINGLLYIFYTIFSGEWRALLPIPGSLKRALQVTLYDLGMSKKLPLQGKYNDAQRIAYTSVIILAIGSVVTGFAIYKPTQVSWLTSLLGGYEWARWEHFWLMGSFAMFFIVHIGQVIRAGWSNFRSMITGYEVVPSDDERPQNDLLPIEEGVKA